MSWKIDNFQVPNHPNWTGKTYRTSEEAFKGFQFKDSESQPMKPLSNTLGIILGILLIVVALAGFIPRKAQGGTINYADRSLNKTIVVKNGSTSTRYDSGTGGVQIKVEKTHTRTKKR